MCCPPLLDFCFGLALWRPFGCCMLSLSQCQSLRNWCGKLAGPGSCWLTEFCWATSAGHCVKMVILESLCAASAPRLHLVPRDLHTVAIVWPFVFSGGSLAGLSHGRQCQASNEDGKGGRVVWWDILKNHRDRPKQAANKEEAMRQLQERRHHNKEPSEL